jgi:hypothetical protein
VLKREFDERPDLLIDVATAHLKFSSVATVAVTNFVALRTQSLDPVRQLDHVVMILANSFSGSFCDARHKLYLMVAAAMRRRTGGLELL